jgi:PEP-CTERM motif
MRSRLLLGVAALLALLPVASSTASVFNWEGGICTLGCTGTATGVLTLADGGTPFSFEASNFVSFQFTSSSGTFTWDNTSSYLAAQGGGWAGSGLLVDENAYGPHSSLPLVQFDFNTVANPTLTLSPDVGSWQLLVGSYAWTCINPECSAWTNDVVRNVGVGGVFTAAVPEPSTWAMSLIGFVGIGFLAYRRKSKPTLMAA